MPLQIVFQDSSKNGIGWDEKKKPLAPPKKRKDPDPVAYPKATKAPKRKRTVDKTVVHFPETSDDPDVWRVTPRKEFHSDFSPLYPPTTKGPGISSFNCPGLTYFQLLEDVLYIILKETNRYGNQRDMDGKILYNWDDVTMPELLVYVGILMSMGCCIKNDYR